MEAARGEAVSWLSTVFSTVPATVHRSMPRVLAVLVVLVIATAPIEGYLRLLWADAVKLPSVLLLIAWLADLALSRRAPRLHVISALALVLLAVLFVSAAAHSGNAQGMFYVIRWAPFLIITVVLIDLMTTTVAPITGILAFASAAVMAASGALYSFLVLGSPRATGPMEDPNDLASVLTAAIPLLLIIARTEPRAAAATLMRVGALICLAGAAVTVSRGGFIAMTVVALWLLARRLVTLREIAAGATVIALIGAGGYLAARDVIDQALTQKEHIATTNVDTRTSRWEAAMRGLTDEPVLGMGPGGAAQHYSRNSFNAEPVETAPATHNMYIEVASEIGLPAFAVFVAILAAALVATTGRHRRQPEVPVAVQGGLLAIFTTSIFLSEQYYMHLWASIAIAAAADLRNRKGRAT